MLTLHEGKKKTHKLEIGEKIIHLDFLSGLMRATRKNGMDVRAALTSQS